jgi:hypothetical protein
MIIRSLKFLLELTVTSRLGLLLLCARSARALQD